MPGRSVARDLRVQLLGKYLRLPGARFDTEPVPSMLMRLGCDTEQVAQAAVDAMKVMLSTSLTTVAMLVGDAVRPAGSVTLALLLLGAAAGLA